LFQTRYPYSDIHTLNLDWVLEEIKAFREELEQIEDYGDRITQLEVETDKLERDLNSFKNTYESFVNTTRHTEEELQRQIRNNDTKISNLKTYVLNLEDRNADEHKQFDRRINNLVQNYAIILQDIANLKVLISQGDDRTLILAKTYADQLIEEFKRDFPKLYELYVYSPVTGQIVTVQEALNEIYETYRFYAITALEFDELGWGAEQLDNKKLTALELDTNSRELLKRFERDENVMRNPWYGDFTYIRDVIYKLLGYHIPTLNAYQRDIRELTAQEMDDRDYTAYYYDWGLNWVYYQTCQQRDDLGYTAQALDDLELTAYTYDSEGGYIGQ
jgi:DNA repair exonuclease SbcCD ATPase subunit